MRRQGDKVVFVTKGDANTSERGSSQNVTVRLINGGVSNDALQIWTPPTPRSCRSAP